MKIDELLEGPQINSCDEIDEVVQTLADFIRDVITKRGIQARLSIYMLTSFGELVGVDWLTSHPPPQVTLRIIHAAQKLHDEFARYDLSKLSKGDLIAELVAREMIDAGTAETMLPEGEAFL